jgi:hypothetical protein
MLLHCKYKYFKNDKSCIFTYLGLHKLGGFSGIERIFYYLVVKYFNINFVEEKYNNQLCERESA